MRVDAVVLKKKMQYPLGIQIPTLTNTNFANLLLSFAELLKALEGNLTVTPKNITTTPSENNTQSKQQIQQPPQNLQSADKNYIPPKTSKIPEQEISANVKPENDTPATQTVLQKEDPDAENIVQFQETPIIVCSTNITQQDTLARLVPEQQRQSQIPPQDVIPEKIQNPEMKMNPETQPNLSTPENKVPSPEINFVPHQPESQQEEVQPNLYNHFQQNSDISKTYIKQVSQQSQQPTTQQVPQAVDISPQIYQQENKHYTPSEDIFENILQKAEIQIDPGDTQQLPNTSQTPQIEIANFAHAQVYASPLSVLNQSPVVKNGADTMPAKVEAIANQKLIKAELQKLSSKEVDSSQQKRVDIIQRIVKAARLAVLKGQAKVKLLLHPPQLGNLRVDLIMKNNHLEGTMKTETEEARELLRQNLTAIKETLQDKGITVNELHIEMYKHAENYQGNSGGHQKQQKHASGDHSQSSDNSTDNRSEGVVDLIG